MNSFRSIGLAFGLALARCAVAAPEPDRYTAEQHVVRERQHTKKSRKQRLKELQRKAFEGK